ncbi:MAG: ribosome biogenesis GTPase Der [Patescibacteria group bacterium]
MSDPKIPTVVLVGRTNVGKSTLFNKLLEQPKALVSKIAGTTRDRNEGECLWRGNTIRIVDTGGFDVESHGDMEANILKQTGKAIKLADLILFLVDTKTGPMPQDTVIVNLLKKTNTPVIVVANKAESQKERMSVLQTAWPLKGLSFPVAISASRGSGIGDLLDLIFDALTKAGKPPVEAKPLEVTRVAVIGKPNVGKSSLLNAILGEERFITSPIAHTTREPNDTLVTVGDKNYILIDTAGMRKSGKVKKAGGLEEAAIRRNEYIVRIADITILVVDATEPIGTQEKTLAGFLKDSGSGVIIIVNKWDLVEDKTTRTMNQYRDYIAATIPFLSMAPVMFVSALTKQRVKDIFKTVDLVQANRNRWIGEKELERFIRKAIAGQAPIKGKGPAPPKILGLKQVSVAPPTFDLIIKVKRIEMLHPNYIRYLTNQLLKTFPLVGTTTKINIRIARSVSN